MILSVQHFILCLFVPQVFVPVLRQRGAHHDQPSRGAAEEHGGVSASVLLRLRLRRPSSSAAGHLSQVGTHGKTHMMVS